MIMWVSIAVAIATALRPEGGPPRALLIAVALSYAAFAGTLTAFQETRLMQRARQSLTTYLAGSVLLVGLLCLLAVLDSGVMTVFFAPIVQVAMYLGLVLPKRWARASLGVLVLSVGAVELLHPTDAGPQAALMAALTIAAWQVGRVCHRAHDSTAQAARRIAHTDVLTGCLNRRGFVLDVQARISRSRPGRSLALLLIDVDKLGQINDDQGRGAGDRALAWAGEQLAAALPPGGTVGRLGGNDFAMALPNTSAEHAIALAGELEATLGPRIGCRIGIAISEDPSTAVDDFLRVALASLEAAEASGEAPRALVAGSTRGARHASADDGYADVTYEEVRSASRRETAPTAGVRFGHVARDGFWVIGVAGAVAIAAALGDGIDSTAERVMLWIGAPWVAANLLLGWWIGRQREITDARARLARISSAVLLSLGVSTAMIASGGIATPIVAALYLKTMFDAAVMPTRGAAVSTAITLVGWSSAALFTPISELWVVPYQLTLFIVSFGLGAVGRRAFLDARSEQLRLAHTDVLTGLRNRRGFTQGAERAFQAAVDDGTPLTIIAFDVDPGDRDPDARDELLREVADVLRDVFPAAHSLSRLGGEEFIAAIPAATVAEATALAGVLAARLSDVAPASIGCAVYPHDGDTLDALLLRADHRSYASNAARTRHSPLSVSDGSAAA